MTTVDDYEWFEDAAEALAMDSCLTFVKGRTVDEVARALGGSVTGSIIGVDDLHELQHKRCVAAVDLPGGVLLLEQFSLLGITKEIVKTLARGTTVATIYHSENNDEQFIWAEDGDVRSVFDFYSAAWREGSDPDGLLDALTSLEFNLSTVETDDPDWVYDEQASARALALAEHLTGIRLTEDFLAGTLTVVHVPDGRWGSPLVTPG